VTPTLSEAVPETVIAAETVEPLAGLVIETAGGVVSGGGLLTVNVNVVVRVRELPVPVTVIVDDPVGVDAEVVSVNVDEQVGLHEAWGNEAVVPAGRPDAANETDCVVPETRVAVIVLDADCPWTTDLFPPLESEKSKDGGGGGGAFTVNVNVVVRDTEPPAPVTVIVDDPVGVDAEVVSVSVDEQAGLHDAGENEAVVPVGRPDAANKTDCVVPETRVAVIVLDTDCPWTTDLFPPLESEKSKDGGGGGAPLPLKATAIDAHVSNWPLLVPQTNVSGLVLVL